MRRILAIAALAQLAHASSAAAEDWVERFNEDGIAVHTRPMAESSFQEFRGRTVVPAPLDSVLATILDGDRFHEWFPDCPRSELLERNGDVQLQYTVTAAPWPVSDRDAIYEMAVSRDESGGSALVRVGVRPDAYPLQDSMVRVEKAKGSWTLRSVDADRTEVTFQMHLEPGGGIPAWLANARVVDTPKGAMVGLRARFAQSPARAVAD